MSKFIIYGLVDPRTDEVRYIGKSVSGTARPREHGMPSYLKVVSHKTNWIKSLHAVGLTYRIRILGMFDNAECLSLYERWAIAYARACGWRLTNITDGGDGTPGWVPSAETRERMRISNIGKQVFSAARRKHISDTMKAIAETPARKEQLRDAQRLGALQRLKNGYVHSEATRNKIAKAARGRTCSDVTKQKCRLRQLGRNHSPETIAKMRASAAHRRRNDKGIFV